MMTVKLVATREMKLAEYNEAAGETHDRLYVPLSTSLNSKSYYLRSARAHPGPGSTVDVRA
jgi:hypothetical protein